ncbi:hypothetical protein AAIB48_00675 (plasmid) [Paraclostridium benzoelyticum]
MKIKIAICDDEYIHRGILLQYIGKLFSRDFMKYQNLIVGRIY